MKQKSYRLEDLKNVKICIGYVGENKHTQVRIDCSSAFAEYPGATPALAIRPPRGGIYPAVIDQDGDTVVWTVTNGDLLFKGDGELQFSFIRDEVIKKTFVGKFEVMRSIITTANAPDGVAEWLIRAVAAAAAAEAAARHQPMIGLDGYWYKWDSEAEEYVNTGTKAQGPQGEPGDPTQLIDDVTPALNKTFSSSKIDSELNTVKSDLTLISDEVEEKPDDLPVADETGDFYIADENGNALAEFNNGNVKTKNFDSSKAPVTKPIATDDDLVLCDSVGNVILQITKGHIKTKGFSSLDVKPNTIKVRLDGTGDFTNIREAVESITDADAVNNPYVIEIYEGTYNVCDYYTQAEIESAGETPYTDNSFVGLKLTDGISIRGVGCREKVVLYGYLDPATYTELNRNNIATLNTQGEMSLENLTIIGENIRYAVHDDFHSDFRATNKRNPKRILKNCVFVGINTTGNAAYGAGSSTGRDYEIIDCVFDREVFGLHMSTGMVYSSNLVFENCTGVGISLGDYSSASTDAVHSVTLNNCNIGTLGIFKANNGSYNAQHLEFFGTGGNDPFFTVPSGFVYQNGSVIKTKTVLSLADAVDADYEAATAGSIYGVCIGTYNGYSYVQRKGYILASLLGLTASAGDYAGVSAGKVVIQNTASDSIGKVIERNNKAYIKLTI